MNLDRWVTNGEASPPSQHPSLSRGTAVSPEQVATTLQAIPGVDFPNPLRRFSRLDFGFQNGVATKVPAIVGKPYPILVSVVDEDGNETAGIRMPIIKVPLATHTGWNLRHAEIGGEGQILSSGGATGGTLIGSSIPFPATREEREERGDPRRSIEERYQSKDDYIAQVRQAAQEMIEERYILTEDLLTITEQAAAHYDELAARVALTQATDN